jgi:outer membrane lipoprotein-sorting protein
MQKFWNGIECGTPAVAVLTVLLLVAFANAAEDAPPAQSALSTDAIVQNLMAANARRAASLRAYRSKRIYKLDYSGIFSGHAEMQVEVAYRAPNEKSFKIVSENGSKLLIRQVLMKLLQSEQEAQEERNRKALEMGPANYDFRLESTQHMPAGDFYVLEVKPKKKSKYVYNGRIWVDARDFAVARMEGAPASNPSFWVSHVEIQFQWTKVDGFWLPVHNYSVTNVRMGGRAVLNISYSDYQVTGGSEGAGAKAGVKVDDKNPTLPDPSSLSVQAH